MSGELDDLQKTAVDALWVLTPDERRAVLAHFCRRCVAKVEPGEAHDCPGVPRKDEATRMREHRRKRRNEQ